MRLIGTKVSFSGLEQYAVDNRNRAFIEDLVSRLEQFRADLLNQLNERTTGNTFDFQATDPDTGVALDVSVTAGRCERGD